MRVLFASTYCLLDTTNGAAHATRELLSALGGRRFLCHAVTASICDPVREVFLDDVVAQSGATVVGHRHSGRVPIVELSDHGFRHTVLRTASSHRTKLTAEEEQEFLRTIEQKLEEFEPDIVLTYGGLPLERRVHTIARLRGATVVFFLHNSLYVKRETFSEVDRVLVPSRFLQDFYRRKLGLESRVLYPLFASEGIRVDREEARYVTFINPTPLKGLSLFSRLAEESLRRLPSAEFLVDEGRWTEEDARAAGFRFGALPNVRVIPHQKDVRSVYALTRVLLYPSFWIEAFGRTVVEAQGNGIPVLASRQGGIPEALNGGGFLLDVPQRCVQDHRAAVTADEVGPWIDRLRMLLENPEAYEEAGSRALRAAEAFSSEKNVLEAVALFEEDMARFRRVRSVPDRGGLVRKALAAGRSYPKDKEELREKLSGLLTPSRLGFIVPGVLVPSASRPGWEMPAGKVYRSVHVPEDVILFGPNDSPREVRAAIMREGEWEIPSGRIPIRAELAALMMGSCPLLEEDAEAYLDEQTLEAQLPFVHYLNPRARIVPVALSRLSPAECLGLGRGLAEAVRIWGKPVLLVATVDGLQEWRRNHAVVARLLELDPEGFFEAVVRGEGIGAGFVPAAVAVAACRELGARSVEWIADAVSDGASDSRIAGGYAGFIFRS